jgi:hypothetical protein
MHSIARRALKVVALGVPLGLAGLGGCTSTSAPPRAAPDAQAICPNTLADTVGAPCAVEGLVCSPQYSCGVAPGIARCVCTSGAFACSDLEDAALEGADATPSCPPAKAPQKCPLSELAANLAACMEPGLQCTYRAGCDATPGFDTCQCSAVQLPDGGVGSRFVCTSECRTDAAAASNDAASAPDVDAAAQPPQDARADTTDAAEASD